jgi:hypothetical protein
MIDRRVSAVLEQEAVADQVGIQVEAHDVAAVVDAAMREVVGACPALSL